MKSAESTLVIPPGLLSSWCFFFLFKYYQFLIVIFLLISRTSEIESRLKFFQQVYHLSDIEVRQLATGEPRLVTSQLERVKVNKYIYLLPFGRGRSLVSGHSTPETIRKKGG